jgi:hypothetical protein
MKQTKKSMMMLAAGVLLGTSATAQTWDCGFCRTGDDSISCTATDAVTATLDGGTLTISGTGKMKHFRYISNVPWYYSRSDIAIVVIEQGVTSIGNYAFYYCNGLSSVTIPEGVTSIGNYAFYY